MDETDATGGPRRMKRFLFAYLISLFCVLALGSILAWSHLVSFGILTAVAGAYAYFLLFHFARESRRVYYVALGLVTVNAIAFLAELVAGLFRYMEVSSSVFMFTAGSLGAGLGLLLGRAIVKARESYGR